MRDRSQDSGPETRQGASLPAEKRRCAYPFCRGGALQGAYRRHPPPSLSPRMSATRRGPSHRESLPRFQARDAPRRVSTGRKSDGRQMREIGRVRTPRCGIVAKIPGHRRAKARLYRQKERLVSNETSARYSRRPPRSCGASSSRDTSRSSRETPRSDRDRSRISRDASRRSKRDSPR